LKKSGKAIQTQRDGHALCCSERRGQYSPIACQRNAYQRALLPPQSQAVLASENEVVADWLLTTDEQPTGVGDSDSVLSVSEEREGLLLEP
jgi:hypothetical protein